MFGIGWAEFLFLGVAALLVLGPEKLPQLAKQLGKWMAELRSASSQLRQEFRSEFDQVDLQGFSGLTDVSDVFKDDEDPLDQPEDDFGTIVRDAPAEPEEDDAG